MSEKVGAYGNKASEAGFRRKWDTEEFAQKAKEKDEAEKKRMQENDELMKKGKRPRKAKEELPKPTELMKQREHNLELDKNLNKTIIVQNAGGRGPGQPGFYCDLCQRTCKDTSGYLDHVNSRQHLRRLGQTTQVARSTLDQVRARIALLREKTKEVSAARTFDFEKRLQDIKDAEIAAREEKKRRKQEKNKPVETEEVKTEEDDTMASMMGFGGFGSSKK
ncbi:Zinc-finger double-stranded RNA-binding domain-containing protein [Ceratobasidium sp. AG-Ba]|nr:Zinc-finger double-stranded RNA-binding domain-containing protein [Ceratobasidium sp. AG-Ba]